MGPKGPRPRLRDAEATKARILAAAKKELPKMVWTGPALT